MVAVFFLTAETLTHFLPLDIQTSYLFAPETLFHLRVTEEEVFFAALSFVTFARPESTLRTAEYSPYPPAPTALTRKEYFPFALIYFLPITAEFFVVVATVTHFPFLKS